MKTLWARQPLPVEVTELPASGWTTESKVTICISVIALIVSVATLGWNILSRRAGLTIEDSSAGYVKVTNIGTGTAWNVRARVSPLEALPGMFGESSEPDSQGRKYIVSEQLTDPIRLLAPGSSVILELPPKAKEAQTKMPHRLDVGWFRLRWVRWLRTGRQVQVHRPKLSA